MNILKGRILRADRSNLLPVFCAGVLAGILTIHIGKTVFLENTGLFDESVLSGIKYMTVDCSALFYYILRKRALLLLIMAVLASTYLGGAVCVGAAAWCGMAVGAFFSALTLRYGIKGLALAAVSLFPQCLFYVPAVMLTLGWCESLYRAIYLRGGEDAADKAFRIGRLLRLGAIGVITLLGCLLEGYVNPRLLAGYLKIF